MGRPARKSQLRKELEAITGESGAAIVRFGDRSFVVVEIESDPVQSPSRAYEVTDPEEAAALRDALDDSDNPSFSTEEALRYLRSQRAKRDPNG